MVNKANKTSFKKGQSGNPKGRPVSALRKEVLNEMLATGVPEVKEVFTKVIEQAKQGNMQASRLFLEYIAPKPDNDKEEDNLLDNLTDEETSKMYDFLLTIVEKENVAKFIENANKVTAFVKEMKARRIVSI